MTRLFLIRHGESVAQVEGFLSGHDTCRGLSDLGRRQATALRDRLARTGEIEADVLLTSILPRAIETAEIIAPAIGGHEPIQDCDLCEIHGGEAEGLTWEQVAERFPRDSWQPDSSPIPGAETWIGFHDRVARTLRKYAEEHEGKTIVAAVHGGICEASVAAFMNLPASHGQLYPLTNTSITEWVHRVPDFRGGEPRWQLVRYNDAAHLADLS
ncbi:MAG: ribonuclease / adenosylcobalamin/alpha-ribazole phosphatase [Actinomycetota bacterium]|jgi:probable phosphoglycerate mutase|nr:ribonuclease / adenosylcobalamin/alpha-ribazole phosphatase [Actinomycetota bacterium]